MPAAIIYYSCGSDVAQFNLSLCARIKKTGLRYATSGLLLM